MTSVGLAGFYDPYAWLPYRVSVRAPEGRPGTYTLRALTTDLDGDRVQFDRPISLAGGDEQSFWGYLKLPPGTGQLSPAEDFVIALAGEDGEEIDRLKMEARPPDNIQALGGRQSGRLLLLVGGEAGGFYPGAGELVSNLVGTTATNVPASVRPGDLPDDVLGYDAVFAVVWQDADPARLLDGGGEKMQALRAYIRAGGRLIVTHRSDWDTLQPFFDLLPVTPIGAVDMPNGTPLATVPLEVTSELLDALEAVEGPVRHVVASANEDVVVESWYLPPPDADVASVTVDGMLPMLVRGGYGFGSVTWLATDLSNRRLLGRRESPIVGWTEIWGRLLDTGDAPVLEPDEREQQRYSTSASRDFASAPQADARLAARGAALVTLAVIFFIGYWLIAGPGVFFFLKRRGKPQLTWWAYGAIALGAAGATVLLTGLVLRGPAELRHVSLMRAGSVADQTVASDFGLYIPRDGSQEIRFGEEVAADGIISPLIPPRDRPIVGRTSPVTYRVDVAGDAEVAVPYRSTLKKFEARLSSSPFVGLEGRLRLDADSRYPSGQLVNATEYNLQSIHVAYKYLRGGRPEVMVLYVPELQAGGTLPSLRELFDGEQSRVIKKFVSAVTGPRTAPAREEPVEGRLVQDWALRYWYEQPGVRRTVVSTTEFDDWSRRYRIAPAVLSFFSMLPPMTNINTQDDAVVLLNRGAAEWDATAALSAGHVVIVAEAREQDVPLPLEVEGRRVPGTGTVVTQFVLPLSRPVARPPVDLRATPEDETQETSEDAQP